MYHISVEDGEGILTNANAFYLGYCRKGGLVHYTHVMTITSGPLGLVPGLGMDYLPPQANLPGLSRANHLILSGSVPVLLVRIIHGMYQCMEINFYTSEMLLISTAEVLS